MGKQKQINDSIRHVQAMSYLNIFLQATPGGYAYRNNDWPFSEEKALSHFIAPQNWLGRRTEWMDGCTKWQRSTAKVYENITIKVKDQKTCMCNV